MKSNKSSSNNPKSKNEDKNIITKKKTLQEFKEVVENIEHIYKRVKFTNDPNFRYLVPSKFVDEIFNMLIK